MKMKVATGCVLLIIVAVGCSPAAPKTGAALFARYIEVVNEANPGGVERLLHPRVAKAFRSRNPEAFEATIKHEIRRKIPDNYVVRFSRSTQSNTLFDHGGQREYPVRPTHSFQIDFDISPKKHRSIFRYFIKTEEGCFLIWGVPRITGQDAASP